jgi:hypothetical protein
MRNADFGISIPHSAFCIPNSVGLSEQLGHLGSIFGCRTRMAVIEKDQGFGRFLRDILNIRDKFLQITLAVKVVIPY